MPRNAFFFMILRAKKLVSNFIFEINFSKLWFSYSDPFLSIFGNFFQDFVNFARNFPNIQSLHLYIKDIQSPPQWTNELLIREISDNFKESSEVLVQVMDCYVCVTKYPFDNPKIIFDY